MKLRATPQQRDLIGKASSLMGKSRSDFILEAACERARAVVIDQLIFNLDADKFQQFTALLDSPAAPSAGHQRLMALVAPWKVAGE